MSILTFISLTALGVALAALWTIVTSMQKLTREVTTFVNARTTAVSSEVAVVARNLSALLQRVELLEEETAVELRRQRKLSTRLENELARARRRDFPSTPSRPQTAR